MRTIQKRYLRSPTFISQALVLTISTTSMLFFTYISYFECHIMAWLIGWSVGWIFFLVVWLHMVKQMCDMLFHCPYKGALKEQEWGRHYIHTSYNRLCGMLLMLYKADICDLEYISKARYTIHKQWCDYEKGDSLPL